VNEGPGSSVGIGVTVWAGVVGVAGLSVRVAGWMVAVAVAAGVQALSSKSMIPQSLHKWKEGRFNFSNVIINLPLSKSNVLNRLV
jgi:hypothetical protein